MIPEFLIALFLGVIVGTFTGLFPGIHVNLIAAYLVAASAFLLGHFSALSIALFIISVSITHTFVDYVPSIFLGAPDEDSFLSILPGHQLLIEGQAHKAVVYTIYGGLIALPIIILFSFLFVRFLPLFYPYVQRIMPLVLILTSIFLILFEKSSKILALTIFFLSGFLGIATLNLPLKEPMLPLFTGLFGISSLVTSLMKKQKIPEQKIWNLKDIKIPKKSSLKAATSALIASPLASFLPGLGASQAAIIGSEVTGDLDQEEFLILLGIINTVVMGLSFITLYAINKTRTGSAEAVSNLLILTKEHLPIILITIILSGILSAIIALNISKIACRHISKVNYKYLSISIISLLVVLIILFSGVLGLLVLIISTALGLFCILQGIKRTQLMGTLLIPTILFYLV